MTKISLSIQNKVKRCDNLQQTDFRSDDPTKTKKDSLVEIWLHNENNAIHALNAVTG